MASSVERPSAGPPGQPARPASPPTDGDFRLVLMRGECAVLVAAPRDGGRPVELAEARAALAAWPLDDLDERALERAVRQASGKPVVVGRIRVAPSPADRAPAAVKVAADRAEAVLLPWAAFPLPIADPSPVVAALRAAGVTHGIDRAALAGIVGTSLDRPLLIARATPPGEGEAGSLEPLVELLPFDPREPEPHCYPLVAPGDPLLRRLPPTVGSPGTDVTGTPIPGQPGPPARLDELCGPGARLDADGERIVAAEAGRVMLRDRPNDDGKAASQVVVVSDRELRRAARESADGAFELSTAQGQVWLRVDPPAEGGTPVKAAEVFRALGTWPLDYVNHKALEGTVEAGEWMPVPVAEIVPSVEPPPDAPFAIKYLAEARAIYLVPWAAPTVLPLGEEALRATLAAAGFLHGLDAGALADLATGPWNRPAVVGRLAGRDYRVHAVEEALVEAARDLALPLDQLTASVEETEKAGWFGLGRPWLRVAVHPLPPAVAAPAPVPGRIEIRYARGELAIRVLPPRRGGEPVTRETVLALLERWDFPTTYSEMIDPTLRRCSGEWVALAAAQPTGARGIPITIAADAPIAARASRDGLIAWIIPWAAAPAVATSAEVAEALRRAGIIKGIDSAAVERCGSAPIDEPVVVARGQPAEAGADARIEFIVPQLQSDDDPDEPTDDREDERGRIDFRTWIQTPSVPVGATLAVKTPMVPAKPGYTVWGTPIAVERPKDVALKVLAGQGTEVEGDSLSLRSTLVGMPSVVGRQVIVQPVHVVEGDVDYKVGNLDFHGAIVVTGDVLPGFRVKARGRVIVRGSAEAAFLESDEDVLVGEGIVGQGKGSARAGGSIRANLINATDVEAGKLVEVDNEIVNASVVARDSIRVGGRIVGGQVSAGRRITAGSLGSASGGRTRIEVGKAGEANAAGDGEKDAGTEKDAATPRRGDAGKGKDKGDGQESAAPRVVVRHMVYPGVQIAINGARLKVETPTIGGTFREDDGQVLLVPN